MANRPDVLDGSWARKTLIVTVVQDSVVEFKEIPCADLTLRQFLIILEWSRSFHVEVDYLSEIDEEGTVQTRPCYEGIKRVDIREFSPKTRKDYFEMLEIHDKFMCTYNKPLLREVNSDGPSISLIVNYS